MTDALIRSEHGGGVGRADQIRPQRLYPVLQAFADLLAERLTGVRREVYGPGSESLSLDGGASVSLRVSQDTKGWSIVASVEAEGQTTIYTREGERWVLLDTEPHAGVTDEEFLGALARLFD
jgi:hypothetical protein